MVIFHVTGAVVTPFGPRAPRAGRCMRGGLAHTSMSQPASCVAVLGVPLNHGEADTAVLSRALADGAGRGGADPAVSRRALRCLTAAGPGLGRELAARSTPCIWRLRSATQGSLMRDRGVGPRRGREPRRRRCAASEGAPAGRRVTLCVSLLARRKAFKARPAGHSSSSSAAAALVACWVCGGPAQAHRGYDD